MCCAETAVPIEKLFGMLSQLGPENHVLDGDAHWCLLANTVEPPVCGSNVALCQIILKTCF